MDFTVPVASVIPLQDIAARYQIELHLLPDIDLHKKDGQPIESPVDGRYDERGNDGSCLTVIWRIEALKDLGFARSRMSSGSLTAIPIPTINGSIASHRIQEHRMIAMERGFRR